jgi:hypothetical protein
MIIFNLTTILYINIREGKAPLTAFYLFISITIFTVLSLLAILYSKAS